MQYRTEIHIAADRYVCLQLPDFIPEGRATVTVSVTVEAEERDRDRDRDERIDADADDRDVEWWDEFDAADDPRRG